MKKADYIFETSWEVCNKVGGIYTVISTKAFTVVGEYADSYICIGPDLSRENEDNKDFTEDPALYSKWKLIAQSEGLKIRIGRWNISGNPIVILVDFTPFFEKKNDILTQFWLKYKLDSISGQWDYIEPAMFGYAAGKVIESFYNFHCNARDNIIAQFHEWMTGTGILHLEANVPQIATIFTTHATVLGRCIAGNGLPLYGNIAKYDPIKVANDFGVQSKHSLESLSAKNADAYTTVSEITNKECTAFFEKPADTITINGFENNFVPKGEDFIRKRDIARKKLLQVSSALLQHEISPDSLFVLTSGRYEYKNKGIDLFIEGLSKLKDNQELKKDIIAVVAVPAGTSGIREDLIHKMESGTIGEPVLCDYVTHPLHDPGHDPLLKQLSVENLDNAPERKVKVIFVPVYLNGNDGIFNLEYYDLLIGFDLTIFPSYYEPWGYTPLESIAFGIPTVTTSLAGFGMWAREKFCDPKSIWVIERTDTNDAEVSSEIAQAAFYYANCDEKSMKVHSVKATEFSQKALWKKLFNDYLKAYDIAIVKSSERFELFKFKTSRIGLMVDKVAKPEPHWKRITIKSNLSHNLKKLEELSQNFWWSWNYEARELFMEIAGEELWKEYDENPVHILQILPLERIESFSRNTEFLSKLNFVHAKFKEYMNVKKNKADKKIAYFSMEFGISNEFKNFSGGLGILAGDYLKEASDSNVNMVAVGLLYRNGYFSQQISLLGDQINLYPAQSYSKLPLQPIRNSDGEWEMITFALPGRTLYARMWKVNVGRIPLYLLDTDFDANLTVDRRITYNLYGGDNENRLKQEIVLGIGGIRVLEKLGEKPSVYHCNEGHAAFLSLERLKNIMQQRHVSFSTAMELIRASSLYTTHTPVPAGHDTFSEDLMRTYFSNYPERYNISWQTFMGFGRKDAGMTNDKFSMSILACKFSQEINGVSKIHGRVSREMFEDLYEGKFANELHIGYVTNGVHYPTWAHKKWQQFHSEIFGEDFVRDQSNPKIWEKVYEADDNRMWQIKDELRAELIEVVKENLQRDMKRRSESPSLIVNTVKAIRSNTLTVGFARRFATYKRAYLLFLNEEKLKHLVNNPERPIQFIFAGKAHPNDKAGQDLIKKIIEFSRKPEFIGKIIFLENYDMNLAKKLVSGCDIWLNNPTRPLEASGTSGEKAIMNGVLNFSVLDGWWAEGYVPEAGWAINEKTTYTDDALQDELDAATLYSIFEEQITPSFYNRDENDVPKTWVRYMKNNFAKICPHFTMKRQLEDYYAKFYYKLEKRTELLRKNNLENAVKLIRWKEKVLNAWDNIEVISVHLFEDESHLFLGQSLHASVELRLATLSPEDIKIEILFTNSQNGRHELFAKYEFEHESTTNGIATFCCTVNSKFAGMWDCAIRMIPQNKLLPHDMDFNLATWL